MKPPVKRRKLKKIVSISTSDQGSGAEVMAWSLFKKFEERGFRSWLLVGDKKSDDPRVLPFFLSPHLNYDPYRKAWRQKWQGMVKSLCRRFGIDDFVFPYTRRLMDNTGSPPDVVLCHNLHGGYFDLRGLAPLSRQIPVFVMLQDMWLFTGHCAYSLECPRWETGCGRCPDLARSPAVERDATRFNWWRKARLHRGARYHVAAPSRWILERAQRSMLAPAIVESRVIPNGIDCEIFYPLPRSGARARLGLPQEGHLLVFAAYHAVSNPYKDYPTLKAALERLSHETLSQPVHCVVIGQTAEPQRWGKVTLQHLQFTDQATLADWYRAANLYVHSASDEVFGMVIAEAMACGTPVIATDVGGISEVVQHQEQGLLVPPKDATALASSIALLLEDPWRCAEMGCSAAQRAKSEFDMERIAGIYLDWFSEIISSHPGGRR